MSVREILARTGPRKLLALDGGGIRGLLSIGVLDAIERHLRATSGNRSLVLGDYFDYIGGTSTGAIIATCLSFGMSVDEIRSFYVSSGPAMFHKAPWWTRLAYHQYRDVRLAAKLKDVFGAETKFGSERLRTLLMIVLRNAATDSPWPLSNNPRARYNSPDIEDNNLELPLWQMVRASAAAPRYFPPENIQVGRQRFKFVDGALTTFNNPAFHLFLMATLEPYRLQWPVGPERMLLVSVGTGSGDVVSDSERVDKVAATTIQALIRASVVQQDLLCRVFGECLTGESIDSEIGDLLCHARPAAPLFTYARFDTQLTRRGLERLGVSGIDPAAVQKIDSVEAMDALMRIGEKLGEQVSAEHFRRFPVAEDGGRCVSRRDLS